MQYLEAFSNGVQWILAAALPIGILAGAIIFYFLPTVIASKRRSQNQNAISLINLFFGWTVLGWIAALLWALVEQPEAEKRSPNDSAAKNATHQSFKLTR